jgi:hypothetical protein
VVAAGIFVEIKKIKQTIKSSDGGIALFKIFTLQNYNAIDSRAIPKSRYL